MNPACFREKCLNPDSSQLRLWQLSEVEFIRSFAFNGGI